MLSSIVTAALAFQASPLRTAGVSRSGASTMLASALVEDVAATYGSVRVEGTTLKTWDIGASTTERVQLSLKSEGRPVNSNIELWHTPSYIPARFNLYTENGKTMPINAVIETPKHPKTIAVFNTGAEVFPFEATVANTGLGKAVESIPADAESEHVQGGQIKSYTFGAEVNSVGIYLKTVEKNMKAMIEVTQGPNQVKQYIELYSSVGYKNPFYAVLQLPGDINTVRVINQNTVEFPFDAYMLPME